MTGRGQKVIARSTAPKYLVFLQSILQQFQALPNAHGLSQRMHYGSSLDRATYGMQAHGRLHDTDWASRRGYLQSETGAGTPSAGPEPRMTCLVPLRHLFTTHLVVIGLLTLSGCGQEPLPITPVPQDLAPAWHPQGQQIALQHEGTDETSGVYLARIGTTERQLLLAGAVTPDWSPDGTQLVVGAGSQVLRVVVSTGQATPISSAEAFSSFPSWSPNGRWVAFSSNGGDSHAPPDLWLANVESNTPPQRVPLAGPPRNEMFEKDWSPSSDRLVVSVAGSPQRLFVTDTSGRDTAYITSATVNARMPTWQPQGEWIAYVRTQGDYGSLWLIRPNGAEDHFLVPLAAYPSWSPDGQRLAFSRPSDSSTAIWSVNLDGSDPQQLTFP
jgi:dipeptidyl aminopeptidase/acylaminoacyl peptidase